MPRKRPRPADPEVTHVGVGYWHTRDFVIDRPAGSGDTLFLRFLAPARLVEGARVTRAGPGDCFVYSRGRPQLYMGDGCGLANDWMHFTGPAAGALLRRYRVPRDEVFRPRRSEFVPAILGEIETELRHGDPHAARAVGLLFERLMLLLARELAPVAGGVRLTPQEAFHLERMREVRTAVHASLAERWTVAGMAERAHLSASRFAVLYRKLFDVSPLEDLLRARLTRARWLLTNTALQVQEVARESGFESAHYFSRVFRARVGCAPRDYYRLRTSDAAAPRETP